jgi:ubiquinone/menaquinone biosynthesis C-methylase UbiE
MDTPAFRKSDRYKDSSFQAYNFKMPDRYDDCIWLKFCRVPRWDQAVIDLLQPQLTSSRILDVGCATGRLLLRLATTGAGHLCGTDLAPRILEAAREKLAQAGVRADLRPSDAEDHLPWPDRSFDVVTLTGVLHHFFRPLEALQEIRRVLRPGGRLILIDPGFFPAVRQLINLYLRWNPHDGDFRFYSSTMAAGIVRSVGFQLNIVGRIDLWSYLIAAANRTNMSTSPDHSNRSPLSPSKHIESKKVQMLMWREP